MCRWVPFRPLWMQLHYLILIIDWIFLAGSRKSSTVCEKLNYTDDAQLRYEVLPNKYGAECILKIILDPTISSSVICTVRRLEITTYVVDIHSLTHPESWWHIKNDNFGKWEHSGSHPVHFKVEVEDDDHVFVQKCAVGASEENIGLIRRLHSVHPSNHNFKRMIAFVSGKICYIILRWSY